MCFLQFDNVSNDSFNNICSVFPIHTISKDNTGMITSDVLKYYGLGMKNEIKLSTMNCFQPKWSPKVIHMHLQANPTPARTKAAKQLLKAYNLQIGSILMTDKVGTYQISIGSYYPTEKYMLIKVQTFFVCECISISLLKG